jgi:hypothetical protein
MKDYMYADKKPALFIIENHGDTFYYQRTGMLEKNIYCNAKKKKCHT